MYRKKNKRKKEDNNKISKKNCIPQHLIILSKSVSYTHKLLLSL